MSTFQSVSDDSEGGALVVSSGGDVEALAGPLPLDGDGLLALDVALALADGSLLPLVPRGSALPASAEALLTTRRRQTGDRRHASSSRRAADDGGRGAPRALASHAVAPAPRGRAQARCERSLPRGAGSAASLRQRPRRAAVVLSDLPENLPLLERNAKRSGAAGVAVVALDWLAPDLPEDLPPADVVLAADCVFWPHLFDPLLDTLGRLRRRNPDATLLISCTHRLGRTAEFLRRVAARGWVAAAAPRPDRPGAANTDVYELRVP
ncbi:lysine N-methyltransferase [Aureococcus anophagefferens]|uniref:Lysine N-methyltransferase n=1 Tax=Aureococcus anophagefferens TaxID=44056 RepID=A0ABR1G031_AURAN